MPNSTDSRPALRLLAEFLVIVVGVLVALAVDRWFLTLDERELERTYVVNLIADVRADSASAVGRVERAARRREGSLMLLEAAENPDVVVTDTARFLLAFETVAWSILPDFRTATWDDLISSGNTRVIRDENLRRSLSEYFDGLEFYLALSRDWDQQLQAYDDLVLHVNPPSLRLEIVERFGGQPVSISSVDLARVRNALSDPPLHAQLGQVAIIRANGENMALRLGEDVNRTLRLLVDHENAKGGGS
jgi:hypothetical protein